MLGIISITQTSEGNLGTVFEVDSQARFFDIDQTVNIDIATAFNANIGTCDVGDVDNDSIGLPNLDDDTPNLNAGETITFTSSAGTYAPLEPLTQGDLTLPWCCINYG